MTRVSFEVPNIEWRSGKSIGGFTVPGGIGKPLKNGDIIFTREPDMKYEPELTFDVAFTEPEIIEGYPLLPTVVQMADHISQNIVQLRDAKSLCRNGLADATVVASFLLPAVSPIASVNYDFSCPASH